MVAPCYVEMWPCVLLLTNLLDSTDSSLYVDWDVVRNPPKSRRHEGRLCCHLSKSRGEITVLIFSFNEVNGVVYLETSFTEVCAADPSQCCHSSEHVCGPLSFLAETQCVYLWFLCIVCDLLTVHVREREREMWSGREITFPFSSATRCRPQIKSEHFTVRARTVSSDDLEVQNMSPFFLGAGAVSVSCCRCKCRLM